jgi:protein PhnA
VGETHTTPFKTYAATQSPLPPSRALLLRSTPHVDSNGVLLATCDTVVLIKDLPVKGKGFTAKRGTAVQRISLVADNPAHIEGRVDGQRIVT